MNRKVWDQLVSTAALVVAAALIVLGGLAIYGGQFGQQNVRDRLAPQRVNFPPLEAMSPEEQVAVGEFAGQQVATGPQAEAFSRYIGGHLEFVNDGKTYAETSAAARAEGLDPEIAADLRAKADVLFGLTPRATRAIYDAVVGASAATDPGVPSQILISSHSPFVICAAWNGEERDFIYQVKPEGGQALIRPFSQIIDEQQIQLAKVQGKREHLSLNVADQVMAGYYS